MRNLVTLTLLLLFVCYSSDGVPQSRAMYDFAMNFYVKSMPTEAAEAADVNFVFSPFSMHTALSLLTCGATTGSDTEAELISALGGFAAKNKIKDFYKDNLPEYKRNYTESLQYANGLFTSSDFFSRILSTYKTMAKQIFDSEFIELPANNPAQLVNNWVANKTQSKIPSLFNELSPDMALLLVNAIYFKGTWLYPFDDEQVPIRFTLDGGNNIEADMMSMRSTEMFQVANLTYNRIAIQAVRIRYKESRFAMTLLMPQGLHGLHKLETSLLDNENRQQSENAESFGDLMQNVESELSQHDAYQDVLVTMPKFTVKTKLDASLTLKRMKIREIFTSHARLAEITSATDDGLKVEKVSHEALVEVTKEGTVGAAATGIELGLLSFQVPITVNINKPFLFLIQDIELKIPIFLGRVKNPSA